MRRSTTIVGIAAASGVASALALSGVAGAAPLFGVTAVPAANTRSAGLTSPNVLSPQLAEVARAQGSTKVENPQDGIGYYGYDSVDNDPPLLPVFSGPTPYAEAHKTEPDKNTYLVLKGQRGPDSRYDYGTHFLFQGHESGSPGYVTRVNLDADQAHRVTILTTRDTAGAALPDFDGSTYDPFTGTLLMTAEAGCKDDTTLPGGVWGGSPAYTGSSTFTNLAALGSGGYEGVQTASDGSVWLVEDASGASVDGAKLPNSFVYRFVPQVKGDLTRGRLESLQVLRGDGSPITFDATNAKTADVARLHTYGTSSSTRWVTVHDTATDGTAPFCANKAAKSHSATPFKRPENGVFRPGSRFGEFYFTETGDTSTSSTANDGFGGYGGVFRLRQSGPSAATGTLSLAFRGDREHTGLDNITFATDKTIAVVEDAGDSLHQQRNALDSGFLVDVSQSRPAAQRFLAEGRDPSATIDAGLGAAKAPGFDNDGDNELTGIVVSDGDPTTAGLLGAKTPQLFTKGWRAFYTAQHGDNVTWELVPDPVSSPYATS
jgi:Bacterial protein of unknown function (DUF839)